MTTKIDGGLRPLFKKNLPAFHWTPVESPMTGGIPDTNGCLEGVEVWVEFKLTHTRKIDFRPEQPGWIHRRYRAGGRVWIAIRLVHEGGPRLGPPVDDLILIYGGHVLDLAREGVSDMLISGRWRGGPRRWDWQAVGALLVGAQPTLGDADGGGGRTVSVDGP